MWPRYVGLMSGQGRQNAVAESEVVVLDTPAVCQVMGTEAVVVLLTPPPSCVCPAARG